MKFAENGYYIEKYIKCDNCGVLIYDEPLRAEETALADQVFCGAWCVEWKMQRERGVEIPSVTLSFDA